MSLSPAYDQTQQNLFMYENAKNVSTTDVFPALYPHETFKFSRMLGMKRTFFKKLYKRRLSRKCVKNKKKLRGTERKMKREEKIKYGNFTKTHRNIRMNVIFSAIFCDKSTG
jgi:hypothetical protein